MPVRASRSAAFRLQPRAVGAWFIGFEALIADSRYCREALEQSDRMNGHALCRTTPGTALGASLCCTGDWE